MKIAWNASGSEKSNTGLESIHGVCNHPKVQLKERWTSCHKFLLPLLGEALPHRHILLRDRVEISHQHRLHIAEAYGTFLVPCRRLLHVTPTILRRFLGQ